jgi:hypothetical protein
MPSLRDSTLVPLTTRHFRAGPTKHCVLGYPSANRRSLRSLRSDRDDNRGRRVFNSAFV